MESDCESLAALGEAEAYEEDENSQLVLFGLSLCLLGGAALKHLMRAVPLPYTVLLLLLGTGLGVWTMFDPAFTLQPGTRAGGYTWGPYTLACNVSVFVPNTLHYHGWHLGNALRILSDMDGHLILHLLLPPLLFESAFAIDWHVFTKVWGYALLLAGPGLVMSTVLTGLTYAGLYTGWPWEAAMLMGGILAATDPVAVVALLREMGVKRSLATLIEAESLLNDGTAVVVFAILLEAVQAGSLGAWLDERGQTGWFILWSFIRLSVLGPLLGCILGILSVKWLQLSSASDHNADVEVVITIAMPFLVFYLAETAFGGFTMSGVLAVVSYGLVYSSPFGQIRIDPHVSHFLHSFWSMVGHLVNTILFIIAGIIIVTKVVAASLTDDGHLLADTGFGVAIYACMTVYRAIMLFGAIPLFKHAHYGFDWRDALVCIWGGLRGAVGLALALAITSDELIVDCDEVEAAVVADGGCSFAGAARFKRVALLHMCITVGVTLLVNAPSSSLLVKAVGLTKLPGRKVSAVQVAADLLREQKRLTFEKMCEHPIHLNVNWEGVDRLADFDSMVNQVLKLSQDGGLSAPRRANEARARTTEPVGPPPSPLPAKRRRPYSTPSSPRRRALAARRSDLTAFMPASALEETPSLRKASDAEVLSALAAHALAVHPHATTYHKPAEISSPGTSRGSPVRRPLDEDSQQNANSFWPTGSRQGQAGRRGRWPQWQKWQSLADRIYARALAESVLTGAVRGIRTEFHQQLYEKRVLDAKYHLLERLKANVWCLYETGIISGITSSKLKKAVLDELDELDMNRHTGDGVLAFDPLHRRLAKTSSFHRMVMRWEDAILSTWGERARAFPLSLIISAIRRHTFVQFEREYDLSIGYLLAHEHILEEHDLGTRFSLDHAVDLSILHSIGESISQVTRHIALMRLNKPAACAAAATLKATRMVLNKAEELISSIARRGALDEEEAERLIKLIRSQEISIRRRTPTDALPRGARGRLYHQTRDHSEETIRHEQAGLRHSDEHRSLRRKSARSAASLPSLSAGAFLRHGARDEQNVPDSVGHSTPHLPVPLNAVASTTQRIVHTAGATSKVASHALRAVNPKDCSCSNHNVDILGADSGAAHPSFEESTRFIEQGSNIGTLNDGRREMETDASTEMSPRV